MAQQYGVSLVKTQADNLPIALKDMSFSLNDNHRSGDDRKLSLDDIDKR